MKKTEPEEKPKKKSGRQPFEPTPEQRKLVASMVAYGINRELIAKVLGITKMTLYVHFRPELETSKAKAITTVANKLYQEAMDGNMTAAIFFLKTQAGWSDKINIDHTSGGDKIKPLVIETFRKDEN